MSNRPNRVVFWGALTADPDPRELDTREDKACVLRLANHRRYIHNGEKRTESTYVTVEAYRSNAAFCLDNLKVGDEVLVEGRLRLNEWCSKDGGQRQRLVISAERIHAIARGEDE